MGWLHRPLASNASILQGLQVSRPVKEVTKFLETLRGSSAVMTAAVARNRVGVSLALITSVLVSTPPPLRASRAPLYVMQQPYRAGAPLGWAFWRT